ncbi:ABC transporter substrate-binding protein [Neobacillus ginsengisoli]|uniref:ABC-type glycerol-3-phosphate transport system substrate-binding protein n=1 Tax=Neobacillus ginsengisoli TaxID=904295 RepID=A0ABT9XWW6_9BACI|nr:ABC transporter substrate-binding protein [Neobacillus ginsengisoli]MDQ0199816.1 ABC-type glycerol-3-phosphate transport system substrate-binding protein [Neobacillus ginsengisoli]
MKKWLPIIIFAIILIIFAGYATSFFYTSSSNQKDQGNERKILNPIKLTFWRNFGNQAENKSYKELVSAFEKSHPNIMIEMQSIPYSDYEIRLRTQIADEKPPDIMAIDSPNLALYANTGSLLSIDYYMRKEGRIEDIPKSTLNGLTFNGEIYLAPIVESGIALFYNKHLFEEAAIPFPSDDPNKPLTWDQVLNIAKKINKPEKGVYGIDPAQGFNDGESPAYFKMPLLWQFGAEAISADGTTASGYLDSKESVEALQFYQDLYHKYGVAAVELPPDSFVSGKLAMTVLGSWTLADLEKNYPKFKLGEDFGVAPLPKEKYQVVPNGGWSLGISSKTKYPKDAWEFIKYVTSYEGIKKYVKETGDIPARYSVAKDFPDLNQYPKDIFLQQAQKYSMNRPVTPAYPVVSDAIKTLFEEVGIGGKDVRTSAEEAVEKINTGLKQILKP